MAKIKLHFEPLTIPFRTRFEHSEKSRAEGESILVTAIGSDSEVGLGEGCPRSYVTGETVDSTRHFFSTHEPSLSSVKNIEQLREWINQHKSEIDKN